MLIDLGQVMIDPEATNYHETSVIVLVRDALFSEAESVADPFFVLLLVLQNQTGGQKLNHFRLGSITGSLLDFPTGISPSPLPTIEQTPNRLASSTNASTATTLNKLEMEPNIFEQSFSSQAPTDPAASTSAPGMDGVFPSPKLVLPPLTARGSLFGAGGTGLTPNSLLLDRINDFLPLSRMPLMTPRTLERQLVGTDMFMAAPPPPPLPQPNVASGAPPPTQSALPQSMADGEVVSVTGKQLASEPVDETGRSPTQPKPPLAQTMMDHQAHHHTHQQSYYSQQHHRQHQQSSITIPATRDLHSHITSQHASMTMDNAAMFMPNDKHPSRAAAAALMSQPPPPPQQHTQAKPSTSTASSLTSLVSAAASAATSDPSREGPPLVLRSRAHSFIQPASAVAPSSAPSSRSGTPGFAQEIGGYSPQQQQQDDAKSEQRRMSGGPAMAFPQPHHHQHPHHRAFYVPQPPHHPAEFAPPQSTTNPHTNPPNFNSYPLAPAPIQHQPNHPNQSFHYIPEDHPAPPPSGASVPPDSPVVRGAPAFAIPPPPQQHHPKGGSPVMYAPPQSLPHPSDHQPPHHHHHPQQQAFYVPGPNGPLDASHLMAAAGSHAPSPSDAPSPALAAFASIGAGAAAVGRHLLKRNAELAFGADATAAAAKRGSQSPAASRAASHHPSPGPPQHRISAEDLTQQQEFAAAAAFLSRAAAMARSGVKVESSSTEGTPTLSSASTASSSGAAASANTSKASTASPTFTALSVAPQPPAKPVGRASAAKRGGGTSARGGSGGRRSMSSSVEEVGGGEEFDEEDKRRQFLERNRQAAYKCRQKKKQWLTELQTKVESMTGENERLRDAASRLREEVLGLKAMLLAHRDCAVAVENGLDIKAIENTLTLTLRPLTR
ncbi:hypothetical protein HDU96_009865 [Phlyctochytrium bullatum]|nr:hypothetical protein HDU96_009865 [Phlyctochytrium bullatum]